EKHPIALSITSERGRIYFQFERFERVRPSDRDTLRHGLHCSSWPSDSTSFEKVVNRFGKHWMGFGIFRLTLMLGSGDVWDVQEISHGFFVPHVFAAVVLAIAPAAWLLRRRRDQRRRTRGLCVSCGYDLRASSGRCPE